jgi:hypothetical protein
MPLAAGPQAKGDAVEHPAQVHTPMPLGLGGLLFVQHPREDGPHLIWTLPERGRRCFVALVGSQGHPPLGEEGYRSIGHLIEIVS